MLHSQVKHISYYLPQQKFTNDEFYSLFPDELKNPNYKKIGISERRIAAEGETETDMMVAAAEKLFTECELKREEVDMIVSSFTEPDHYAPQNGPRIHYRLGLRDSAGTVDIHLGCTGFIYTLLVAKGMITSGQANHVLILTSSRLTHHLHPKDKANRYLFGDAGAAIWLSKSNIEGVSEFVLGSDGRIYDKIIQYDGQARHALNADSCIPKEDGYGNITDRAHLFMDGTGVFYFTIKRIPELVRQLLEKLRLTQNDIDVFVFHQANGYIIDVLADKMNIPHQKVFKYMNEVGNTVSCSIPICLHEAQKAGRIKSGSKVMVVGFGVGMAWGASVLTF